jgi:hypothetical protein
MSSTDTGTTTSTGYKKLRDPESNFLNRGQTVEIEAEEAVKGGS